MKKIVIWCMVLMSFSLSAQLVEPIKFTKLQEKILSSNSELTVFNFWATWCAPCIKELPHFETLNSKDNVKVYLVSLDFPDQLDKVRKFISKKNLNSEVLFLDEKDPDTYISKVSQEWSGAIPATLFVTDLGKTFFYEKAFDKEELEKTVNEYLY
ncbi:MAG: TlpA disulfide reductase family protein [Bacteroidota bacterium]